MTEALWRKNSSTTDSKKQNKNTEWVMKCSHNTPQKKLRVCVPTLSTLTLCGKRSHPINKKNHTVARLHSHNHWNTCWGRVSLNGRRTYIHILMDMVHLFVLLSNKTMRVCRVPFLWTLTAVPQSTSSIGEVTSSGRKTEGSCLFDDSAELFKKVFPIATSLSE